MKEDLKLSSLGLGTYNGPPSNEYDYEMFRAVVDTIKSGGVNVIDTCPLYRYGKSEKVINAALNYLINEDDFER
jgi:aryl-alcohol dehydrogenase-like predicted oxidoreductase